MYVEIPEMEKDFSFDSAWNPEKDVEHMTVRLWDMEIYSKDYPVDMRLLDMEDDIKVIVANKLAKLLED